MLCACIDIGSNTTRVLVAQVEEGNLTEVACHRAFTRLGRVLRATGALPAAAAGEIAAVVAEQRALAERAGAERLRVVATAAIRGARGRDALVAEVAERAGVAVDVLDGREEARLAFLGATGTLGHRPAGRVAVVDVGGGSTEVAVGTVDGGVEWAASAPVGSGALADAHLRGDPPPEAVVAALRAAAAEALADLRPPAVAHALAVGGSATSLRRLVGPRLDQATAEAALRVVTAAPAEQVAARHDLDPERVRLLPAGIALLEACARALGRPLEIGCGGIREGVCLELGREH